MSDFENSFSLKGKVALVTGGSYGIGSEIVRRLAQAGADVAFSYRSHEAEARAVAAEVCALGRRALALRADVTREEDVAHLVRQSLEAFGQIDVLVNNAGIYPHASILDASPETWDEVQRCNVKGPFLLTQAVARAMIERGAGGRIVNVTSVDAIQPEAGLAAYDASKGALLMFTRTSALEFAPHGITVNAVGPGLIDSPELLRFAPARRKAFLERVPLGRVGAAADVANAVVFLSSPAAGFITGQTLYVEGGVLLTGYMTGIHEQ